MVKELFNIYQQKVHFLRDIASGDITTEQVAIIADTSEIWANGVYTQLLQRPAGDDSYTITSYTLLDIAQSEGATLQVNISSNDLQFGALSDAIANGKAIYIKLRNGFDVSVPMLYCYEDDFIYCAVYNTFTQTVWELEITNIVRINEVKTGTQPHTTSFTCADIIHYAEVGRMQLNAQDSLGGSISNAIREGRELHIPIDPEGGYVGYCTPIAAYQEDLIYLSVINPIDNSLYLLDIGNIADVSGPFEYINPSREFDGYKKEERTTVSSLAMEANKVYIVRSPQRSISVASLVGSGITIDDVWTLRFATSASTATKVAVGFPLLWKNGEAFTCPQEDAVCELIFRKNGATIIGEWKVYK